MKRSETSWPVLLRMESSNEILVSYSEQLDNLSLGTALSTYVEVFTDPVEFSPIAE